MCNVNLGYSCVPHRGSFRVHRFIQKLVSQVRAAVQTVVLLYFSYNALGLTGVVNFSYYTFVSHEDSVTFVGLCNSALFDLCVGTSEDGSHCAARHC